MGDDDGTMHTLDGCSHNFHARCIVEWFRHGHSSCPMCRSESNAMEIRCSYDRARAVRAAAHRRSAPAELVRRVKRIRAAEETHANLKRALREHMREHRNVIRTNSRLQNSVHRARCKARQLMCRLSDYVHPAVRVPLVEIPRMMHDDSDSDASLSWDE